MKALYLTPLIALAAAVPAQAANLSVDLDGVRSARGTLYVSVQTREQFMQDRGAAGTVVRAPAAGSHRFAYELPAGEYAVSVWHDENGNGEFDKDENSMPIDGWSMVNGNQLRGEPSFDQVRTVVGNAPAAVRLGMVYSR
jgi:uncharacterized protein (DUF2141 family)